MSYRYEVANEEIQNQVMLLAVQNPKDLLRKTNVNLTNPGLFLP